MMKILPHNPGKNEIDIYWGLTLQRINKKNEAFLKDP